MSVPHKIVMDMNNVMWWAKALAHNQIYEVVKWPKWRLWKSEHPSLRTIATWLVQQLGPDQWSLRPVKFKTSRELPIIFRGIYRINPNSIKEKRRMSTCDQLELQTLGSQLIMPKTLPDHWSGRGLPWDTHYASIGNLLVVTTSRGGWCPNFVFGHIESLKIWEILNPTGFMLLASSGFASIHLRYILP